MDSFKAKAKRVPGLYRTYRTFRAAYNVARSLSSPFLREVPAGHFYSPLPDMREIARKEEVLFRKETTDCPGVNLRANEQLRLLDALSPYYEEVPFSDLPDGSNRYYYNNDYFGHGDAIILYAMLRHFKPRRIIEVGSGFSSAVMLDTSEHFLHDEPRFTFIEPYPDRLLSLLDHKEREQYTILKSPVQDVSPVIFQDLAANDILFIDSSHVVKIGSDVHHLLFHILPRLNAGVIVHFHDILWPFEYKKNAFMAGIAWNEAYFVRAFMQFNDSFEILYFNSFLAEVHPDKLRDKMPDLLKNPGGSLWLQKTV